MVVLVINKSILNKSATISSLWNRPAIHGSYDVSTVLPPKGWITTKKLSELERLRDLKSSAIAFPFNDWAPALFFWGEFSPLMIVFWQQKKTTTKIALKINKKNTIKFIGFLIPFYRASLIQILTIKQLQFNDQKADRNQAKLPEMMFLWQRIVMDQKMDLTNLSDWMSFDAFCV